VPRGIITSHVYGACLTLLWLTASSLAQSSSPASSDHDQETITQLVEQIKQLQRQDHDLQERIQGLEARQLQVSPQTEIDRSSPAITPQSAEPTPPPQESPVVAHDWHEVHGIQWRGFGEVNYKVLDRRQPELSTYGFNPGSAGNFYTGDFDLFLASKISDKASVLSEIAFGEGNNQIFSVDLERFLLKYDFNDHLKMSFGRFQTGVGFYNLEFRSARWLLVTADRPLIMEFSTEGGLLPTQAVGIFVTGLIPSGKLGLNYIAEYGSSDTQRSDINASGKVDDENNGNHINMGLFFRPEILPGLQIGGSFYHDKISDSNVASPVRIGQTIVNAHVVYVAHGIEFLNEGFLIRHAPEDHETVTNMSAFYSQFSKRFGRTRPFFRYQYINADREDTVFEDVGLRYGPSAGARYDFSDNIAFKAQLDHTVRKHQPDLNGLQMQVVFTF
jgi:hypothetical protein